MPTNEEKRLFAELAKRGVVVSPELNEDGPRNTTPWDIFAKSTSVSPSSPKQLTPADAGGIDTGTFLGRGNPADRSGGSLIPPKQPGANAPSPTQQTGSNEPGSSIRQALPALQQYPTQVVTIPTSVFTSSKD